MEQFGDKHFKKFCELIYTNFGISTSEAKKEILHAKLDKLISKNNLNSYDEYYKNLVGQENRETLIEFANAITVNQTSFFRENNHFEYIKNNVNSLLQYNPGILKNNEIRVWSSACSTGEEPYTISIVLSEYLPKGIKIRVLATDINSDVLASAQKGLYPLSIKNDIELVYLNKYFNAVNNGYTISDDIKKLVTFRQFNLMDDFPFKGAFDIVFCRNVMIYFDQAVRQKLLSKFYNILVSGGLLFIGHSESITQQSHHFRFVHPTVYLKG